MTQKLNIADLHFGNKNNLKKHNNDLLDFAEFIAKSKRLKDVRELNVLGDVFHQRDKLDVGTMNAAMEFFEYLSKRFDIRMLIGNHDMYYKDRRDIHSLKQFQQYVDLVDYQQFDDKTNTLYTSWLITGEEYDDLIARTLKDKIKTVMGHFEFSTFRLNDNYIMEHGQTHKSLSHVENIITGHYHKRQIVDNVAYIGTPFPFDFNDANDTERGVSVFDDDLGMAFLNYDRVKVVSVSHQDFLDSEYEDSENTTIRVVIDESIDQDTMDQIKDKMSDTGFSDSRVQYKVDKNKQLTESNLVEVEEADIADIDSLVKKMISNMDEGEFDKQVLNSIYKESIESEKV